MARGISDGMVEFLFMLAIGAPLAILCHFFGEERVEQWFYAVTVGSLVLGIPLWVATRRANSRSKLIRIAQACALGFMIVGLLALL